MDLRSIVAWRSVLSGGIFVAFHAKLWYDKIKEGDPMNDIELHIASKHLKASLKYTEA